MHVIYKLLFSNPMNNAYNDNGKSSTIQHFQPPGNYNPQNAIGLSQLDPSLARGWPYNVCIAFFPCSSISLLKWVFSKCVLPWIQVILLHNIIP